MSAALKVNQTFTELQSRVAAAIMAPEESSSEVEGVSKDKASDGESFGLY